jgi:hypothetical protein
MMLAVLGGWGSSAFADVIEVKTRAPNNKTAFFNYRVPKSYDANRRESYRVVVMFGGRNTDGKADAAGRMGWGQWCDDNGIFIVSPGLKDDNYWEPQVWSGRALQIALEQIKRNYNICLTKLLFYGYSAGSQASNLFPAWRPEWTRAWVSHACGVFHEPTTRMRGVPGLVTCGDADTSRYIISRNFVENARRKGVDIIWKSFPNHPHDVPPDSLKLARAFLLYYHELYLDDLSSWKAGRTAPMPVAFIGDDLEHKYYAADSAKARNVLPEDRVPLPNQVIAQAWGKPAE